MHDYVHHVPGRLRIKSDALRRDPLLLPRMEAAMASVAGVRQTVVSAVIGSLTVHYQPETDVAGLVGVLMRAGFQVQDLPRNGYAPLQPTRRQSDPVEAIFRSLADLLVEKALERSAVALVRSFI